MEYTEKILVVDDEEVIRELLIEVLGDENFDVVTASGGPQALEILSKDDGFVVLFTDIMMPEMSGLELIREARKDRPGLIPIVMTAYATIETARAAVQEGAYDYVLKPFSLSEVKLAISNALDRHRLASENARLRELTQLFNISEKIAMMRDERSLLEFVLQAAADRVGASQGRVRVPAPGDSEMEICASLGEMAAPNGFIARIEPDNGSNGSKGGAGQDNGKSVSVTLPQEPNGRGYSSGKGVAAILDLGAKSNGQAFTEGDHKTLSIVANQAAAALQNVRLIRDLQQAHLSTLESMAMLIEARDNYTQCHSQRVRNVSLALARRLGLSREDFDTLRIGASFHDIGKIGVPDHILNKPGPLDDEEWQIMRRHPVIGYDVLAPIQFMKAGHLELVRGHHERMDGHGYPDGKKAGDLSILTRIITVADAYDAMASDRAYRPALPEDVIVANLREGRDSQFDAAVVDKLLDLLEEGRVF